VDEGGALLARDTPGDGRDQVLGSIGAIIDTSLAQHGIEPAS
jgi:hypothetical protein